MFESIRIKGAREHNLKNITLEIPKHKLVVLTGPSGSGKSTLAMETLQKECQRQYMESMGMITDSFTKPKVDSITGLSPSISVGQHVTNRNPRSTVGTLTDIHSFLRYVYSRIGKRPCPTCGEMVEQAAEIGVDQGMNEEEEREGTVSCPSCRTSLSKLTMRHFSFNTPEGACAHCAGLGEVASLNAEAVFDQDKSFREGGVVFLNEGLIEYYGNVLQQRERIMASNSISIFRLKSIRLQREICCTTAQKVRNSPVTIQMFSLQRPSPRGSSRASSRACGEDSRRRMGMRQALPTVIRALFLPSKPVRRVKASG